MNTTLAGVPAILRVPGKVTKPPIILWHGFGPPASPQALMDAMPLDRVPSVKVYLGLPLFGARAPAGGVEELIRRQKQDFAKLLFKPSVVGAAEELPAVIAALERRGCMTPKARIGLFGFSAGGASALIVLAQHKVAVGTAIVLNASTGLDASVNALERVTKQKYAWTPAARMLGKQTDAIRHAEQIAQGNPPPALLIVQGADDTVLTSRPATALYKALLPWYKNSPKRLRLQLMPGVSHGWTDGGAVEKLRRMSAAWFQSNM
ncbi:MAG: alpha/beta hydrolase family protein [Rhodanobacteraceae bacterium]